MRSNIPLLGIGDNTREIFDGRESTRQTITTQDQLYFISFI